MYCYGAEERIVSIRRKIKNKLAALLLGNDFVILTAEEHETYISMKHEYERKLAECEFYGADWAGFLEVDPESNV